MNDLQNHIYKKIAQQLNKDIEVTEKICKSVFEFLAETIRTESFEPYRIQGLGIWEVKEYVKYKKKKAIEYKEKREAKNRELFNKLKD